MAGIKDYSTTQANNTDLNGINTAEGMLPSNLNNAIRALMKNTREWFNDSQWVEYGDGDAAFTAAYASATSFTIAGVNVTPIYHAGRRIKLTASTPGTIYGTISSSTFSTNTTVNVTWDSGSLSSEAITNVYIGALSKTNSSIPTEIIGTSNIANGSVTTAKIADNNVTTAKILNSNVTSAKIADGNVTTAKITDGNVTTVKIADANVTTGKLADDAVTVAKMAVNSVDSDQYVDGSIDTAHIADSQITVAKMAANSVDSDQYVDNSIDTAHIADSQITSAKIANGAIVDADVNASAAIDATKIADGSVTSTEFQYINTLSSNAQTQLDAKLVKASNLSDVASASTSRSNLGLGTIATQASDNVSLTGGSITGLGEPSSNSDASTKSYVDQAVAGLRTRIIAECASTANVVISSALEAGDVIDGVTLVEGDRVLLKDQSTASQNGLYLAVASGAGAASRDPEHDTIAELSGGMVITNQGTANDNKIFLCTTDTDATLGSTSITYTTITPQNVGTVTSITAGTGLSGGAITSSGTIAIDTATTVDKTTAQTLTNKTLTSPKINEDVAVTSTATELNILDGITSTTAELNYSDLATLGTTAASKVFTADANNLTTVSGAVANVEDTLTDGATITWNVIDSPVAKVTLAGNRTLSAPSGTTPIAGQFISLLIIQDGTGSRTITWNAVYEFAADTAPTLTATASLGDLFTFRYNGAKWLEVGRNLALTLS